MKVVAYSIQPSEKELLAIANQKKHEITLISNRLSTETVGFATGKDAVIVGPDDEVSAPVLEQLKELGIRFISIRSTGMGQTDRNAAARIGIKLANIPIAAGTDLFAGMALQIINHLDLWQAEKCTGDACICAHRCKATKPDPDGQDTSTFLP